MMSKKKVHPFPPVFDKDAEILILGTFPSVKSRENQFYYGHPQNRFWQVLANIFEDDLPHTIDEKKRFLLKHHIALWDVLSSCEIKNSADSSIKSPTVNNIEPLIESTRIQRIYCNGKKAQALYERYIEHKQSAFPSVCLPSTSPANAGYSLSKLIDVWRIIKTKTP
jgi:hypoxanthine-DNA glycosylase